MSKTWLSEFTDRSEPTVSSPQETSERLGVPLVGGDQGRTTVPTDQVNKPVGVCAKCGLVLYDKMLYHCRESGCPTGLSSPTF